MAVSRLLMRALSLDKGDTTVKLEPEFWAMLTEICAREGVTITQMVNAIDRWNDAPRASAIRVFVLNYLRSSASGSRMNMADGAYSGVLKAD